MKVVKKSTIDVKDLRQQVKKGGFENKFRKVLFFGYDANEINQYIANMEASRELEKNAFLDRISELEELVKELQSEKQEWNEAIERMKISMEDYREEGIKKDAQINELSEKTKEYEALIQKYEGKLQEREDEVVLKENISLKQQLSAALSERNDLAGQLEILKNENDIYSNKVENLQEEVDDLTEKLSEERRRTRDYISGLSLKVAEFLELDDYFNNKAISSLEELVYYVKNHKCEADKLSAQLKEELKNI